MKKSLNHFADFAMALGQHCHILGGTTGNDINRDDFLVPIEPDHIDFPPN